MATQSKVVGTKKQENKKENERKTIAYVDQVFWCSATRH